MERKKSQPLLTFHFVVSPILMALRQALLIASVGARPVPCHINGARVSIEHFTAARLATFGGHRLGFESLQYLIGRLALRCKSLPCSITQSAALHELWHVLTLDAFFLCSLRASVKAISATVGRICLGVYCKRTKCSYN